MSLRRISVVGCVVWAGLTLPAVADFDQQAFDVNFLDSAGLTAVSWQASYDVDNDEWLMEIDEDVALLRAYLALISGVTDSDPIFTLTKSVENNTPTTWDSYVISLDPNVGSASFVAGTASSTVFNLASETANQLVFSGGGVVNTGDTVVFTFDVNISSVGNFNFRLTQEAVPEPASLALLAAGGAAVIIRRRRRKA